MQLGRLRYFLESYSWCHKRWRANSHAPPSFTAAVFGLRGLTLEGSAIFLNHVLHPSFTAAMFVFCEADLGRLGFPLVTEGDVIGMFGLSNA